MYRDLRPGARLIVSALLAITATLHSAVSAPTADAQGASNPGVLPPGTQYGKTFGQWGAAWWQWALQQPAATNPLLDPTGAHCSVGQSGPVWFLAASLLGPTTRSCTIPANKAIFFPVANAFSCNFPTDTLSIGGNRVLSRSLMKDATNLRAEVDGVPIQNLQRYQSHSTNFAVQLPDGNIFGVPPTLCSPTIADGIYIMLSPLSPGLHTIHFYAEFPASAFTVDTTYNLTVSP